jgi:hypothetical protein
MSPAPASFPGSTARRPGEGIFILSENIAAAVLPLKWSPMLREFLAPLVAQLN